MFQKIILAALLIGNNYAFAGAQGDRQSRLYASCVGEMSNRLPVELEVRMFNFPTQLVGTVTHNGRAEAVGIDFNRSGMSIRQSRPRHIDIQSVLTRQNDYILEGQINIYERASGKSLVGTLHCVLL